MPQKAPNVFFRFSTLAIQMGIIIGLAVWGGQKLDDRYSGEIPVFTIVLSLLGIFASLYLALKDIIWPRK